MHESRNIDAEESIDNTSDMKYQMEINELRMKNEFLDELVTETKSKNRILIQNNELLLEKIKTIQRNFDEYKKKVNTNLLSDDKDKRGNNSDKPNPKTETIPTNENSLNGSTKPQRKLRQMLMSKSNLSESKKHDALASKININNEDLQGTESKTMNGSKNFEKNNKELEPKISNEEQIDNWKKVNHKKNPSSKQENLPDAKNQNSNPNKLNKRRVPVIIGTATVAEGSTSGLLGCEKRAWIFINRVKKHVQENDVREYISNKSSCRNETINVKEVPGHPEGLKRFVIAVLLKFKEEMYCPEFWPSGVGIKRFNFAKYKQEGNKDFLF